MSEEDEVYYTVFRHLLPDSCEPGEKPVAFLKVDGPRGPSFRLWMRLARELGHIIAIRPVPAGSIRDGGVVGHRGTDRTGVIYGITSLKRLRADRYEVEAYYHAGELAAAGYQMTLEKRPDGWEVVQDGMAWIS